MKTATVSPRFVPARGGLLQRKCACGGKAGAGGECEECRELQRQAQTAAPQPGPAGGIGSFFVPLIFIFIIMYFVMIRPQKKRQQQQQQLIASLKTGDRVVTNAGIHGLISNVKENTVLVKVADNVKIEMEKSAITTVQKES